MPFLDGERGGSVVECRTPELEVRGSRPTAAVLCPWARHFTPRKYWLITQEAMAPSRHDWKIVDWDVKPQHNQPTIFRCNTLYYNYIMQKKSPLHITFHYMKKGNILQVHYFYNYPMSDWHILGKTVFPRFLSHL